MAGTVFGFYNGLLAMWTLESTPRALLAATNLKAMESGNYRPVKHFLELDVDAALFQYPMLKEAWWYPAYSSGYLMVDPDEYEQYIRKVATYRKTHPHPIHENTATDELPLGQAKRTSESEERAASMRTYKMQINETAEKYADE